MVERSLVTTYAEEGLPGTRLTLSHVVLFHRFQRQRLHRNPLHLAFARHPFVRDSISYNRLRLWRVVYPNTIGG
jgi:hypothetical protein